MQQPPEELVFVIRMWVHAEDELDGAGTPAWRGAVHELKSGQRFYVSGPRDVADFIAARIADKSRLT
jgi:hypothetical protein